MKEAVDIEDSIDSLSQPKNDFFKL